MLSLDSLGAGAVDVVLVRLRTFGTFAIRIFHKRHDEIAEFRIEDTNFNPCPRVGTYLVRCTAPSR